MIRFALSLAVTLLIVAAGCGGGGTRELQPQVISTVRVTASPVPVTATPAPTASPTPFVTRPPTPPPSDTPTPPPVNHNPSFPQSPLSSVKTTYVRDSNDKIVSATTSMTAPSATDPDGDPLTYAWAATTGTITGDGLNASWQRAIADGQEAPGKVTVTAADGRGGTGTLTVDFQ